MRSLRSLRSRGLVRLVCGLTGVFLRLRTGLRRIRWVAQFDGARRVALAAGGFGGQDRALVRVTAHAFGLAAGGSVWWVPKVKGRASGGLLGKGKLRSG